MPRLSAALVALLLVGPSAFAHADGSHDSLPLPLPPRPTRDANDLLPFVAASVVLILGMACVLLRRRAVVGVALSVAALAPFLLAAETPDPPQLKHFAAFKDKLQLRADDRFLYVGSDAFPDHPMMVGITAWQQQVPLPQPYTGKNAWRIPLTPKLADKPISAKTALLRGAIGLAVNGVPVFNALNNRGEDSYLAGELDEFGGHCGRGDDYHYHIAPTHLQTAVGKGNPIAYGLDGFPLYGFTDADGKEPADLDEFNGRTEKTGYRYYSTKKYPYMMGGMRGAVTVRGDQIDPQPKDAPARPAGTPLRGAKVTAFDRDDQAKTYTVKYDVKGASHSVEYTLGEKDKITFTYTDGAGKTTTETHTRRAPKMGMLPLAGIAAGVLLLGLGGIVACRRSRRA